mmetsp:Transcript_7378/g.23219  ORF Transcript_7378/g.23219 Transcript_7378/m.23219 type:complete len:123 (-) Transcript_7378:768-1136(-)
MSKPPEERTEGPSKSAVKTENRWRPICRRAKEGHSQSARCHKRGTMPPLRAWAFVGSCLRGTGVAMFDYADYGETLLKLPAPHFFCISGPGTRRGRRGQVPRAVRQAQGDDAPRLAEHAETR